MKFLCLAYRSGDDWDKLPKREQDELLAQDKVIRERGAVMAPVEQEVKTLRAWNGTPTTTDAPFAVAKLPLAGFSIIEAANLDEVIRLVAGTPCARAKGAIEIRAFMDHETKPVTNRTIEEAAIRALIDDTAKACRAKDATALTARYAPDVVAFDVVNPLKYSGRESVAKRATEWFSSWCGSIAYEIHELSIAVADDVAFCHSLNHVKGTKDDGQKVEMWWRATVCCRKIDGSWMVTHLHSSVPFDMTTGKASLDLMP